MINVDSVISTIIFNNLFINQVATCAAFGGRPVDLKRASGSHKLYFFNLMIAEGDTCASWGQMGRLEQNNNSAREKIVIGKALPLIPGEHYPLRSEKDLTEHHTHLLRSQGL